MSRYFNLFYVVLAVLTAVAAYILMTYQQETLSFYGFAESNETEINYNHPVVVDHIKVKPGQEVKTGEVLMVISRIKSKETLADQDFKIAELRAEAKASKQKVNDRISLVQQEAASKQTLLDDQIVALKKELSYKKSLVSGLSTVEVVAVDYSPIETEISELQLRKANVSKEANLAIGILSKEMAVDGTPFQQQINRLNAEKKFAADHERHEIVVTAPTDGLIGNIFCKEAEHIPSYKTLVSFYEPHSGIIKGYVHEDLTLQVEIGTRFEVKSLKDKSKSYVGKVIGLGSRIVEIPGRLRQLADFKSYGREVLIEIDKNNSFLQKEKVAVVHMSNN